MDHLCGLRFGGCCCRHCSHSGGDRCSRRSCMDLARGKNYCGNSLCDCYDCRIYLYVTEVITSERSIFTKIYIFLLCAVNAIWSGALVWIFVGLMTDEFTHGNLIEVIIIILLGIPIAGFCTLAPALFSWCAAGLAIESANETSISKCVLSTLLTAVCIAVPTLIYVFSASHFFSVAKYFPKFIQNIFA